jgi:endonuclease-3
MAKKGSRGARGRKAFADSPTPPDKQPFDVDRALRLIREAVKPYPKAALFELAEEGYRSLFELLAACIISIRTRDETTLPTARRLFARARTPAAMLRLTPEEIDDLIRACTFHEPKARQIYEIARRAVTDFGGTLPDDPEVLRSFHGVGPKCTNLVLGIGANRPLVSVDVHVHRVTNRWGYVQTRTPEQTMTALEQKLPSRYRVEINALLVPFGKHVCTLIEPACSTCPLLSMCQQVGVTRHK